MDSLACYGKKLQHLCSGSSKITTLFISSCGKKLQHLCSGSWKMTTLFIFFCYRELVFRINPFLIHIIYFLTLSLVGFGILKSLNPRTTSFKPRNLDLFFTSVSASTVSSMSTVEMEVFSNAQLAVMTILMFVGGEVFTSMVGLHLKRSKIIRTWKSEAKVESIDSLSSAPPTPQPDDQNLDHIELSIVTVPEPGLVRFRSQSDVLPPYNKPFIRYDSIKFLGFLVLGYIAVIHILGVVSVLAYLALVSSAHDVLRSKGLKTFTFSIFTVVSTFASCGFVPTNENMVVFAKNSGLLWILIPLVLSGNTLFPPTLRFLIAIVGKKFKKAEAEYLLNSTAQVGYLHLLPGRHCVFLVATVFGFIATGFVIFCSMEWNSAGLSGLNTYQKIVGIVFQCVNARHTGETIVDLSTIAATILVFFVVMMYLPPYTSFIPLKKDEESSILQSEGMAKRRRRAVENFVFSQLSYLVIFVMIICITERKSLKDDPVNFSVFNIIVEVVSAYGNVGFTTGYSCERRVRQDPDCINKLYGFSGKWSDPGKIVLIVVMLFGRLKKFNMNGGRAWKLL